MSNSCVVLKNGKPVHAIDNISIWYAMLNKETRIGMRVVYFIAEAPETGLEVIRRSTLAHNKDFFASFFAGSWSLAQSVERIYSDRILVVGTNLFTASAWRISFIHHYPAKNEEETIIVLADSLDEALEAARLSMIGQIVAGRSQSGNLIDSDRAMDRLLADYSLMIDGADTLAAKMKPVIVSID